jgi:hypothetical protein
VQTVNSHITVFDKTGKALFGPVQINTLFSGFGGYCEQHNDGDPLALYDPIADRWVISQFAVDVPSAGGTVGASAKWFQCVAVSKTADPTGSYFRYAFQYDKMNDYPKMGVWPDGYYTTFNLFDLTQKNMPFVGAKICAYDRASMLQGKPATQQCFQTTADYGAVLPADLDGKTLPPAGAPNTMVALFDNNNLAYWQFQADWQNPAKTTLTGPVKIPVTSFNISCEKQTENQCIPQQGTNQMLDALSDRLMFRLAYRNFGAHESLVVTHAIAANNANGIRWYEFRMKAGLPAIYQQGTYAPDGNHRWMGSAAQDKAGNLLMGFSVSGPQMKPAIHFAGRLVNDPPNQLARGETALINGTGAQLPMLGGLQPLGRWGDYSMMSVDPTDECTFWYTDEYLVKDGSGNWHTRVGTLKLPGCDSPIVPPTSPWVRLTFPEASTTVGGNITLSGEAASAKAITRLEFLADGKVVSTATASPAMAAWNSTTVADGSHRLGVRATDASGWSAVSEVDVTVKNTGGGGGGGCPPGTVDIGGVCVPAGCESTSNGPAWMAVLGIAAALVILRRGRRA